MYVEISYLFVLVYVLIIMCAGKWQVSCTRPGKNVYSDRPEYKLQIKSNYSSTNRVVYICI